MSRWHLTSNEGAENEARAACQRSHLRPSGQMSGPNLYGEAYFKRVPSTPNLVQCGEDDWLCAAGTLINRGQLGERALRETYSDFVSGGVSAVQVKAIGHYAVAIKRGNEVTVFTDAQGSLNLYYFHEDSFWFIANSLSVCASALPDHKIDATKLLVAAVQSVLPGEDTFYSGVKRLFGSQVIRIDLGDGSFRVERIPELISALRWDLPTIEGAVTQYAAEVRSVFQELTAVGKVGLFATGGMDSRTILAALIDQKASMQLMYGIGDTKLTDYDLGDFGIAKLLAKSYDISFRQLDWTGTQPYGEDKLHDLFRTYGFKYEIYGASDSFLKTFSGEIAPYPQLFLGGYSPAFTNGKPWELKQKRFTFEDLVGDAMHYQRGSLENGHCIANMPSYKAAFSAEARVALNCAGIVFPDSGVPLETYVKAKLFMYIRAESRFLNFANAFGHYVAPFILKRLYDPLLKVPFQYRAKDEFQLRLIGVLTPGLLDFPLYSGWGPAHVDRGTFHLVRDKVVEKQSLLRRVGKLAIPPALRGLARSIYARIKKSRPVVATPLGRNATISTAYGKAIMSDPLGRRWFNDISEFSPKELARIRHYLAAVNDIGYSE